MKFSDLSLNSAFCYAPNGAASRAVFFKRRETMIQQGHTRNKKRKLIPIQQLCNAQHRGGLWLWISEDREVMIVAGEVSRRY
ncbi:MAG TPA: hypothetical protein ENJ56_04260 [Anaerolineae bacterium]|nr:hypothetical protein [Anaerolineae bacterium]